MELGLRARQAFADDPVLATQNLGIDVRNRVATLWGAVPSLDICQQAEKRLREVLGGAEVRNELHVEGAENPKADRLAPLRVRSPLAEPMVRDTPAPRQSVARRLDEDALVSQEVLWRPATPRGPSKNPGEDSQDTRTVGPANPAGAEKTPMPLVSLPGYPAHPMPSVPASAPAPSPETKTPDLGKTVEALRLNDARYRRVQPEVRDGVVYLRGTVLRWEHLYDLAKAVSTLPGVQRVVLQDVHSDSD
jgi:osmotically-inducible protein OsmY